MIRSALMLGCTLGLLMGPSSAQAVSPVPPPSPDAISLEQALALSRGALEVCTAMGFYASVSVVDAQGVVKVVLRADRALNAPVAAPRKAATAVAFDLPGSIMEPRLKTDPAFNATITASPNQYNAHGGSLPLHRNGHVVGGLAIADVPHEVADACVRDSLKAFGQGLN